MDSVGTGPMMTGVEDENSGSGVVVTPDNDPKGVLIPFDPTDFLDRGDYSCWGEIKDEDDDGDEDEKEKEDEKAEREETDEEFNVRFEKLMDENQEQWEIVSEYYYLLSVKRTLRMYAELEKDEGKWKAATGHFKQIVSDMKKSADSSGSTLPDFPYHMLEFIFNPPMVHPPHPYIDLVVYRDQRVLVF